MLNEKNFYDLSLLSYFDIDETGIPVSEMIQKLQSDEELKEEYNKQEDRKYNFTLLQQIQPEEYSNMIVKECFNDNQNSGVVYYIFETEEALIFAFRGSEAFDDIHHKTEWQDWKDNFRMFLKDPTWQQLYTLHQLQNTEIDKPFYLCGHSKGGNLAMYAGCFCDQDIQERIQLIYNYDGPGFQNDIIQSPEYQKMLPRIHSYLPHYSFFGIVLNHEENYSVVNSQYTGMLQHNPYSWQVTPHGFVEDELSYESVQFAIKVIIFLEKLSYEDKHAFIEAMFGLFESLGLKTFSDLSHISYKHILAGIKELTLLKSDVRKMLIEVLHMLWLEAKKTKK